MNPSKQPPILQTSERSDHTVTDVAWIQDFLIHAPFGVTAFIQNNQPYLHTNLFAYDITNGVIYMHSGQHGRMPSGVGAGLQACFTVAEMGRLIPARMAKSFDVEYASVVVFGQLVIVKNREQCQYGLQLLLDKYAPHLKPGRDYHPIQSDDLEITTVYRLEIESWSGKMNRADKDFPGTFAYPEYSMLR